MRQAMSSINKGLGYAVSLLFVRWIIDPANKPVGRFWTKPTVVSLLRIPLGFLFIHCFQAHQVVWAYTTLFVSFLSDKVDGEMAKREGPSRWGALVDPWCDKAFFLLCVYALLPLIWKSAVYPLATIEGLLFLVPFFALRRANIDVKSNIYGKSKFGAECMALLALTGSQTILGNILLYTAIPLAVMSIKDKTQEILGRH